MTKGNVTRLLMGDPRPGRTAWAAPAPPSASGSQQLAAPRLSKPAPPETAGEPVLGSEEKGPATPFKASEVASLVKPPASDAARRPDGPPLGSEENEAATFRAVAAISLAGLIPGAPATGGPIFEWVEPSDLLIDESYQRALSERSVRLIRRIVTSWDWRRYKPPVVAMAPGGLQVIDGQHTAIAAATHPAIDKIPVMIVEAADLEARAAAFVGHNTDRLNVTAMQVHIANVAAGDEAACTLERVASGAGVSLLRNTPGRAWRPGETVAIKAIGGLIRRRGDATAQDLLSALVEARCCPVTADQIRAVDHMLIGEEMHGLLERDDLVTAIRDAGFLAEKEAREFAAVQSLPVWKGLVHVWLKKCKKRRRSA